MSIQDKLYKVSPAPHLHEPHTVKKIMWIVCLALLPTMVMGTVYFGYQALMLTLLGGFAAVGCEALIQKFRGVPVTVSDGSAFLTGILVAFNIHANSPWWLPVVGAIFAIGVGKQVCGGLGHNIFNPALIGRAFMLASWPTLMTSGWKETIHQTMNGLPATLAAQLPAKVTGATPLNVMKAIRDADYVPGMQDQIFNGLIDWETIKNLFIGNVGGCIGEVSAIALIVGAIFLLFTHILDWRIPATYIGTVFALTWAFGGIHGLFSAPIQLPIFHILSGGLMLGALFMATDMVTTPITKKGRLIFGIGCGILTVTIRFVGGYPEGVSYSILLMNIATPLIDKWTMPKPFGTVKAVKGAK